MSRHQLDILGLFPAFDSERFGGVQSSGRAAWQAIVKRLGEDRTEVFEYQSGASRMKAVARAVQTRKRANTVLVWHLQLLKLLPFLNNSAARIVPFLHGVEAWLKQDSLTRHVLRRANLILSNSDHTWSRFLVSNPEFESVEHRTVHLGAGSSLGIDTPRPASKPAVLMVGRLNRGEDYKGHRQMIEAWPTVLQRTPDAELWIVGDGDLRNALQQTAQDRLLHDAVRFFGHVSDLEKERLLTECRCLALPSRGEGFGLVYLEAMRLGRPCLVSNADAGREVVNPPEAGLSVDPQDIPAIAAAVERMLTPGPEWDEWSARARSRYEKQFTGAQFQQRLLTALFEA